MSKFVGEILLKNICTLLNPPTSDASHLVITHAITNLSGSVQCVVLSVVNEIHKIPTAEMLHLGAPY
jgi:hypothetical protein